MQRVFKISEQRSMKMKSVIIIGHGSRNKEAQQQLNMLFSMLEPIGPREEIVNIVVNSIKG